MLPPLEHIPLDLDWQPLSSRFSPSPKVQPSGNVGCNELNEREKKEIGGLGGRGTEGERKDGIAALNEFLCLLAQGLDRKYRQRM